MTPYTLLAGASTVIVGGGIATGLGFALKPSSNAANQGAISSQDTIAPPTQTNYSHNYLVTSLRNKPSHSVPATCKLASSCQLFSLQSSVEITTKDSTKILPGNRYVLSIDNASLNSSTLVEVEIDTTNKKYFAVQSAPNSDKSKTISPIAPKVLIDRKNLLAQESNTNGLKNNLLAIQNRRYYNALQDTYVERKDVNHDAFLVFKWDTPKHKLDLYTDTTDNTLVDAYLFKSFEDQKKDKADASIGQLKVKVNGDSYDSLAEIYEIKDQEAIKRVFDAFGNSKAITSTNLDWEKMAKENLMITKLSQLQDGHYYKFVFEHVPEMVTNLKDRFLSLEFRHYISSTNTKRLFKVADSEDQYHCIKFNESGDSSKVCRKFATS